MLTFLHPLVDFCSVAVLVSGGVSFERWILYNVLAFALQFPLGVVLDVRPRWGRLGFAVGCTFVTIGTCFMLLGWGRCIPLAVACVGNALFHLKAGTSVLVKSQGRSGPIGLFISTGAIGLMAGQFVATNGLSWCVVPVIIALVLGSVWQMRQWKCTGDGTEEALALSFSRCWMVAGLLVLVAWRSWAGLRAGGMLSNAGLALTMIGAVVICVGKIVGGFVVDFSSRLKFAESMGGIFGREFSRGFVVVISVLGSIVLCFACSPSHVALWITLLFVAQLATGPVLAMMYDATCRRGGTSFGLNCLGLFMGSLV